MTWTTASGKIQKKVGVKPKTKKKKKKKKKKNQKNQNKNEKEIIYTYDNSNEKVFESQNGNVLKLDFNKENRNKLCIMVNDTHNIPSKCDDEKLPLVCSVKEMNKTICRRYNHYDWKEGE